MFHCHTWKHQKTCFYVFTRYRNWTLIWYGLILTSSSSVIKQKGEFQNGCYKRTFGKFGVLLYSCNTHFEILSLLASVVFCLTWLFLFWLYLLSWPANKSKAISFFHNIVKFLPDLKLSFKFHKFSNSPMHHNAKALKNFHVE